MIRSFIAIEIPQDLKNKIREWQDGLKKTVSGVKWVVPDNIHITLKFLGNINENQIPELKQAIINSVSGSGQFEIEVSGEGCFPNMRRPRVIWLGVEKGKDALKKIASNIENECRRIGFEKERRPYSPHFTVGRVKFLKDTSALQKYFMENPFNPEIFRAEEIILMKSDLTPSGAVYTPLEKIGLS